MKGPQPKEHPAQSDFFAHSPDSVNPMLAVAMDTLRKQDKIHPFVAKFIDKRGLPVWNKTSGSYRYGHPIFRVPVRDAQERKITGFITILIEDNQPTYGWTPRGAKVDGNVSEGVEVMVGYMRKGYSVKPILMMGAGLKPSRRLLRKRGMW